MRRLIKLFRQNKGDLNTGDEHGVDDSRQATAGCKLDMHASTEPPARTSVEISLEINNLSFFLRTKDTEAEAPPTAAAALTETATPPTFRSEGIE